MPGFTESNITLNFPDSNFFRFANCQGYTSLSGYYFKEMDACWFDAEQNQYWLIELKDFTAASLSAENTIKQKAIDIVKKAVDSLCMFLSVKHSYNYALSYINDCLQNKVPDETTQFKFVTIIHCNSSQRADISLINEQFKKRFKPYAELFGIRHYTVVEHNSAKRIIPNNIVQ